MSRSAVSRQAVAGRGGRPEMPRGAKSDERLFARRCQVRQQKTHSSSSSPSVRSRRYWRSKRLSHEIRHVPPQLIRSISSRSSVNPTDRIDGPLKTTGTARYAYEWHDVRLPNPLTVMSWDRPSPRARSRRSISAGAKAAPGVLAIVTAENAGKLVKGDYNSAKLLGGPDIEHYHQAIAVVVAETFEQARAAAELVRIEYIETMAPSI